MSDRAIDPAAKTGSRQGMLDDIDPAVLDDEQNDCDADAYADSLQEEQSAVLHHDVEDDAQIPAAHAAVDDLFVQVGEILDNCDFDETGTANRQEEIDAGAQHRPCRQR